MEDKYCCLVCTQLVTPCASSYLICPTHLREGETAPSIASKNSYEMQRTMFTRQAVYTKL